jgi:hypothetical protein
MYAEATPTPAGCCSTRTQLLLLLLFDPRPKLKRRNFALKFTRRLHTILHA